MLLPSREGLRVACVSELDGLQLLMVYTRKWSIRSKAGGSTVFVNSRLHSYNEHWRFASSVLVVAAPALRIFTFPLLLWRYYPGTSVIAFSRDSPSSKWNCLDPRIMMHTAPYPLYRVCWTRTQAICPAACWVCESVYRNAWRLYCTTVS